MSSPARIVVVARRTAATPKLLEPMRVQPQHDPCVFAWEA